MNIHSTYAKTFISRGLRSSRDPWVAQLGLSSSFSRDDFDRNRGFGRIRNRRSANLFTAFFHAYSAVKSGCWPRRKLERGRAATESNKLPVFPFNFVLCPGFITSRCDLANLFVGEARLGKKWMGLDREKGKGREGRRENHTDHLT